MRSLAPRIKSRWIKADRSVEYFWESCIVRFERVMQSMQGESKAAIKHREELFGTSSEYAYPDLFNMIGTGKDLVGSYPQFREMLRDRKQVRVVAQMIAQHRLQNMVEILHRHEGIVRRNIERQEQKTSKSPSKSKGKKR